MPVPMARQKQTIWCNADNRSSIDGAAFSSSGKLVMLERLVVAWHARVGCLQQDLKEKSATAITITTITTITK